MGVEHQPPRVPGRDDAHPGHDPHFDEPVLLEEDETVPPRPEEEAADLLRSEPGENPR